MKTTIISIIIAVFLIGGAFVLTKENSSDNSNDSGSNKAGTVSVVDGKQIINIDVKGGYSPRKIVAKSDIPTVLRFSTKGTFDCSSSVRIPSLNINKVLPQTGTTDIDIGTPAVGPFQGTCSMGMYSFEIDFQN